MSTGTSGIIWIVISIYKNTISKSRAVIAKFRSEGIYDILVEDEE